MEKHVEQRVEDVTYNKAKLWQIILFAMNNSSTNIYLVAFTFVTYLSTGVLGLTALFVSQLMGYIRIFDGFIDPTIGVIIDKTGWTGSASPSGTQGQTPPGLPSWTSLCRKWRG